MTNPYLGRASYTFWRHAISTQCLTTIDPVTSVPFRIHTQDKIATAGSCFAQHIAKDLSSNGYGYLVTETGPSTPGAKNEGFGVFSARFGNIYTIRQLLQLFDRAYGLFEPTDCSWSTSENTYVDPFRPRIQLSGFQTETDLLADREAHLAAVRQMFEECTVFVFTLGLTEAWTACSDGAVFPLAPGVVSTCSSPAGYRAINFDVASMIADMKELVEKFYSVNQSVKIVLTVSPVPLIATFEDRHALVSTIYSKSALRVVAESLKLWRPESIAYFPSFEIVTSGGYNHPFFADDRRSVTDEGVSHVMTVFRRHFLSNEDRENSDPALHLGKPAAVSAEDLSRIRSLSNVICDEEAIEEASA